MISSFLESNWWISMLSLTLHLNFYKGFQERNTLDGWNVAFEFHLFLKKSIFQNESWSQSYKINLVLKKSKFVLNSLTVCYFNLDHNNTIANLIETTNSQAI